MTDTKMPETIKQLLNDAKYIDSGGYTPEKLTLLLLSAFITDSYRPEAPAPDGEINLKATEEFNRLYKEASKKYEVENPHLDNPYDRTTYIASLIIFKRTMQSLFERGLLSRQVVE